MPAVLCNEVVGEDVLHVAGIEQCVVDVVDFRVHLGVFDGLRNIFNADDFAGLTGYEIGDGASAGIEVVDKWVLGNG